MMIDLFHKHKKLFNITILTVSAITILTMAYHLRSIFNPVLLSLLLAYILNPIANFFERFRIGRTMTIFMMYLVLTTIITLLFILLIPLIGAEFGYLYEKTFVGDEFKDADSDNVWDEGEFLVRDINKNNKYNPSYIDTTISWIRSSVKKWNKKHPDNKIDLEYVLKNVANKEGMKEVGRTIFAVSKGTISATFFTLASIFSLLSYVILLPLYTFFFSEALTVSKNPSTSTFLVRQSQK